MRTTDVIVIGAGHNGLVAACYIARAGLSVLVLERRPVVGGAAVTEELMPGVRVSAASYSLSLLRPDVYRDLELARHGLAFTPKDPQMFVPLPDERHFFVWRDETRTQDELARIHRPDAEAYRRWGRFWDEAVSLLRPFAESPSPPPPLEVERSWGAAAPTCGASRSRAAPPSLWRRSSSRMRCEASSRPRESSVRGRGRGSQARPG